MQEGPATWTSECVVCACMCVLGPCSQPAGWVGVRRVICLQHAGMGCPALAGPSTRPMLTLVCVSALSHDACASCHVCPARVHRVMRVLRSLWPVLASGFSDLVQRGEVQAAANAENKQRMEAIKDLAHKLRLRLVRVCGPGRAAGAAGRRVCPTFDNASEPQNGASTTAQRNMPAWWPCFGCDLCLPTCPCCR
jgi:hypothetical protein